jgi:hypothetical protein
MANFFTRVRKHFQRAGNMLIHPAKTFRTQVQHIEHPIPFLKNRALIVGRESAPVISRASPYITGVGAFLASFIPYVGPLVSQGVTGAGVGIGRYEGGVKARSEGLHGNEARRIGREVARRNFVAGEIGSGVGLLTGAAAGAASAGAAAAPAAESTVPEAAAYAPVATVDYASTAAAVPYEAVPISDSAVAVTETPIIAAGSPSTGAQVSLAGAGQDVVPAVGGASAGPSVGTIASLASTIGGVVLKLLAPKVSGQNQNVGAGGAPTPGGAPGSDSSGSDSGFSAAASKWKFVLGAALVGGIGLAAYKHRKAG